MIDPRADAAGASRIDRYIPRRPVRIRQRRTTHSRGRRGCSMCAVHHRSVSRSEGLPRAASALHEVAFASGDGSRETKAPRSRDSGSSRSRAQPSRALDASTRNVVFSIVAALSLRGRARRVGGARNRPRGSSPASMRNAFALPRCDRRAKARTCRVRGANRAPCQRPRTIETTRRRHACCGSSSSSGAIALLRRTPASFSRVTSATRRVDVGVPSTDVF